MITGVLPKAIITCIKRCMYKKSLTISQAGQDYWVFGEVFNEKKGGYFLDIGAFNGLSLSNTYLLESKYNWTGLCLEANPVTFADLKKNRRTTCLNICLDAAEGEMDFVQNGALSGFAGQEFLSQSSGIQANNVIKVKTLPLMHVLEKHQVPDVIDYASIDIEGAEERVLSTFDFNTYTFRCLTIERPNQHLRNLFKHYGYVLTKEIPNLDCFYVHESFLQKYQKNLFDFHKKKHLALRWR